jgi:hypothetical protein
MGYGSLSVVDAEEVHMPSRITKPAVIAAFVSIAVLPMGYGSLSMVDAEEVHKPSGITEAAPGAGAEQSISEVHKPRGITEPAVIAAFASIAVAITSAIVSLHVSRQQLKLQGEIKALDLNAQAKLKHDELDAQAKLKHDELDAQAKLKHDELDKQGEALSARLRLDQEGLRQAQLTEILKKRNDTYPIFYQIISVYGRNWEIHGKGRDSAWATSFLNALIDNNASNGAFFSDRVYRWYGLLRSLLENLTVSLATGREANDVEVSLLYDIIRGPIIDEGIQAPGLGSYIKDELGSYIIASVSAIFDNSATYERHSYATELEELARNNIESRIQLLNKKNNIPKS